MINKINITSLKPDWTIGQKWSVVVSEVDFRGRAKAGPPERHLNKYTYNFEVHSKDVLNREDVFKITSIGPMEWDEPSREKTTLFIRVKDMALLKTTYYANSFLGFVIEADYSQENPVYPSIDMPLIWPIFYNLNKKTDFKKHAHSSIDQNLTNKDMGNKTKTSYSWKYKRADIVRQSMRFEQMQDNHSRSLIPVMTITFDCKFKDDRPDESYEQKWISGKPWWIEMKRTTSDKNKVGLVTAELVQP